MSIKIVFQDVDGRWLDLPFDADQISPQKIWPKRYCSIEKERSHKARTSGIEWYVRSTDPKFRVCVCDRESKKDAGYKLERFEIKFAVLYPGEQHTQTRLRRSPGNASPTNIKQQLLSLLFLSFANTKCVCSCSENEWSWRRRLKLKTTRLQSIVFSNSKKET